MIRRNEEMETNIKCNDNGTFTQALNEYIRYARKGKVIYAEDDVRVGLYEGRDYSDRKVFTVCTASMAERVSAATLAKTIKICQSFDNFDEAFKYYKKNCEKTALIWGKAIATA